jgi:hypothetical protein
VKLSKYAKPHLENKLSTLYQSLLANGNWFAVYTPMIKSLQTGDNCILLSWLINQQHQNGDDEWIEIPRKTLTQTFGYNKAKQVAIIQKLEQLGVLDVRLDKMPTKRYARVVLPVVMGLLQTALEEQQNVCSVGTENGTTGAGKQDDKGTENGTPSVLLKKKNNTIGEVEDLETLAVYHAQELKDVLKLHNRITKAPNLKQWAQQFQQLMSTDDTHNAIPSDEVAQCMKWLSRNFNGKFTPRIRSASEFCTKFPKLQDAVARTKSKRATKKEHVSLTTNQRKVATMVINRMSRIPWPTQTAGLDTAIMLSVKHYSELRSAIIGLKTDMPKHVPGKRAGLQKRNPDYVKLSRAKLTSPSVAMTEHFTKLQKSVIGWDAWGGKVKPLDIDGDDMRVLLKLNDNDFDAILEMTGNA